MESTVVLITTKPVMSPALNICLVSLELRFIGVTDFLATNQQ